MSSRTVSAQVGHGMDNAPRDGSSGMRARAGVAQTYPQPLRFTRGGFTHEGRDTGVSGALQARHSTSMIQYYKQDAARA
eukprot:365902-Chlamydomonas_euryale.AAC.4